MNYELLEALIQGKKEQFEQAADQIWGFAEMRYQEFQSAQLQKDLLRREGRLPGESGERPAGGRPAGGV